MKQNLDSKRIYQLMTVVENKLGKCFGDVYPELEEQCIEAIDTGKNASYIINKLAKISDELDAA